MKDLRRVLKLLPMRFLLHLLWDHTRIPLFRLLIFLLMLAVVEKEAGPWTAACILIVWGEIYAHRFGHAVKSLGEATLGRNH